MKPRLTSLFRSWIYGVTALALLLSVTLTCRLLPFSHAEGDFWDSTLETVHTGHVSSTFLPDTYPFLCGLVYRPWGPDGIIAMQAAMFAAIFLVLRLVLRHGTASNRLATLAALLIVLDPDLLSSIPKVWDTELTVLLLSTLLLLCLSFRCDQAWPVALTGVVWGLGVAVRPNFALILLPVVYALWLTYGKETLGYSTAVVLVACGTMAAANAAAHGSVYIAQNGPYNFFAGANSHTQWALVHDYNAEASIAWALADRGLHPASLYALTLKPLYSHLAWSFITRHPLNWLWLGCVKLATLLRPDTKAHPLLTPAGLAKLATSLITPAWIVLLFLVRCLCRTDRIVLAFGFAYVLPFVLTNADPRFRVALDVLLLTHIALIGLRLRTERAAPVPSPKPFFRASSRAAGGAPVRENGPSSRGIL